jgi:hypothetical protein
LLALIIALIFRPYINALIVDKLKKANVIVGGRWEYFHAILVFTPSQARMSVVLRMKFSGNM